MQKGFISAAALSAALLVSGASQVSADAGDALVGGIIGGVIGGAIVNENNKKRRVVRTKRVYRQPVYSAQRAENREVQTSLNYFGFPAGTPDGVLGRRSRAAISQYQAHLGYPVTGYLTEYEKSFLLSSYNRAQAGGYTTTQQIASNPMGSRGLLLTYRDQAAGVAPTAPQAGVIAVAPTVPVVPAQPQTQLAATTPEPEEAPSDGAALPNFLGKGEGLSLASHCNTVSLLTNTNGGFTTLASMSDPNVVLNEQFCLARTYAIAQGEELASSIQGVGSAEIAAQCQAFGPVMKDHVAAMSLKPRDAVLQGVSGFVLTTGMAPPQLAATSKICLSVGYRTDDMDVAIGSGLILVALGEQVYAELMGHHLSQGMGATQRADLATEWYQMSLTAVDNGQPAVFAPGQPERTALIRAAATGERSDAMSAPVQPASALPNFKISE